MEINGANILLTGGSLGIGKETAKLLVEKGANVVITGRDKKRLDESASVTGAIPVVFDISDLASFKSKVKECLNFLDNQIDVLINNAGIGVFPKLGQIEIQDFVTTYNTNVFGLALLTQEVSRIFIEQNHGTIINIGSTASQKGFAGGTVYASSKFALRGMTQSWQTELRKHNIRVSLINPSEVITAFGSVDRIEKDLENNKLSAKEIADTIISTISLDDKGFIPEVNIWATNPF